MRDLAQGLGLPAFWRWWTRELAPFVPVAPRDALRRRLLRPVLAFAPDEVVVWAPRTSDGPLAYAPAARIPLGGDPSAVQQAGRAAIEAVRKSVGGTGAAVTKVVVALPAGQVLRKELRLPAIVESDLKQALTYDLDRHTPFKPEELWFDAAVVGRDARKGEIRVDWAAALKTVVGDARRRAEGWGATVVAVTADAPGTGGPATAGGSRLNLLPAEERPAAPWWRRWRFWAPLALVGAVALVAVVLPVWQKRDYVIALSRSAEQARAQADVASGLRAQLETMTADYNFVLERKYGFPSSVQVLEDVTKLLPDDTWLTQFEVKSAPKGKERRRELLLRGESANAGRLVSLLEESKVFAEAAPRSPTTKIQPGPGEIFDLGALVAPVPPPPPIQFSSAPVEPAAAGPAPPTDANAGGAAPAPPAAAPAPQAAAPAPQAAAPAPTPPVAAPAAPAPTPAPASVAANPPPAPTPPAVAMPTPPPPQPQAPPGMTVPRDIPPPPGSVAPPSGSAPPMAVVDGQPVVSGATPGTHPNRKPQKGDAP